MQERMLVISDGKDTYIGYVDSDTWDEEDERIVLHKARRLCVFTVAVGPGKMNQLVNIFPLDEELGPVDQLWITPSSFHFPSDEAEKRLRRLIDGCEANEMSLRAQEAGLIPGR